MSVKLTYKFRHAGKVVRVWNQGPCASLVYFEAARRVASKRESNDYIFTCLAVDEAALWAGFNADQVLEIEGKYRRMFEPDWDNDEYSDERELKHPYWNKVRGDRSDSEWDEIMSCRVIALLLMAAMAEEGEPA